MLRLICDLNNRLDPVRHFLSGKVWPFLDVTLRVVVASIFFKSGQLKLDAYLNGSFDSQISLFADTYKVPIFPPELAAYMAMGAECVFSVMLAFGLFTRFAALGLLGLTGVIIYVFPDVFEHFLWALLLGVVLCRGAGLFSADHMICRMKKMA